MPAPFRSYASRHRMNVDGSARTTAQPGIFERPDGTEAPGVVIFRDRYLLGILTVEDALRLSNELVDVAENA
jgi:hypothetical protein